MDLPAAVQVKYNLLDGIELELMPCCIEMVLRFYPWSPLAGGWLTGKLSSEPKPHWCNAAWGKPRARVEAYGTNKRPCDLSCSMKLQSASGERRPMRAFMARVAPLSPLCCLGSKNAGAVKTNLDAVDHGLEQNVIERLTQISQPECPAYPYSFLQSGQICPAGEI